MSSNKERSWRITTFGRLRTDIELEACEGRVKNKVRRQEDGWKHRSNGRIAEIMGIKTFEACERNRNRVRQSEQTKK